MPRYLLYTPYDRYNTQAPPSHQTSQSGPSSAMLSIVYNTSWFVQQPSDGALLPSHTQPLAWLPQHIH